ncbi:MAG: hypothetical protein CMK89_11460 [Pseudomonadales bacterium]|nr:hypothetical protein [Pseudomonadales bacterium]RLU04218.1 MAG: hypothetical protein D9N11_00030 [Ketobacter sp.]
MLASWIAALFALSAFIYLLKRLGVIAVSREVISLSTAVLSTMNDGSLSDLEKEKAMQAFSLRLFKAFFLIILGSALALLIPCSLLWGLDRLDWLSLDVVMTTSLSWPFLLVSLIMGCTGFYLMRDRG